MATGLTKMEDVQSLSVGNALSLIPAIETYGEMLAAGQLFGCKNKAQGQTLVLMAMSEGLPITEMKRRYHIIGGTDLSMRADYMLAEFRRRGGWYQWIDQGDDGKVATLHIKYLENDMKVSYSIEMAKKAGLVKPKSGWEKNPGEMLRSRCQTKAVRMVCPEVIAGFATDQELDPDGDAIVGESTIVTDPDRAQPATSSGAENAASSSVSPASPTVSKMVDAEDAVYELRTEPGRATAEQLAKVMALFKALGLDAAQQLKSIHSTGARDMGDLSEVGANEIIPNLQSIMDLENSTKATPKAERQPATDQQYQRFQGALRLIAQAEGGASIPGKLLSVMNGQGVSKFLELSAADAERLIDVLKSQDFDKILSIKILDGAGDTVKKD